MTAPANVSWFHCWMGQSVHLIRYCSLSHYDALISPECYHLACFSQDVMISSSGVWRAGVCPRMSSAPLWWCMAPGPAGRSSRPAHGHVVGELLIAHGSAITRGKKCDAGIIVLKILWLYCATRKQTICHVKIFRPAFGGNDCEGPDVEAELCHQQVSSCRVCLQWASIQQVSTIYSVDHCTQNWPTF